MRSFSPKSSSPAPTDIKTTSQIQQLMTRSLLTHVCKQVKLLQLRNAKVSHRWKQAPGRKTKGDWLVYPSTTTTTSSVIFRCVGRTGQHHSHCRIFLAIHPDLHSYCTSTERTRMPLCAVSTSIIWLTEMLTLDSFRYGRPVRYPMRDKRTRSMRFLL